MFKNIIIMSFIFVFLTACTNARDNTESNKENTNTEPINYEMEGEREERLNIQGNDKQKTYPEQRYSDAFTNEESIMLSKELERRRDVTKAQVASTDDRVIVAVMLQDHADHNITKKLRKEIEKMIPDKQVIIYTDDTHWDRMKNIDAKMGTKNIGNENRNKIKDFFNTNK